MGYSFSNSSGLARLLDLTVNQLLDGILIVNDISRRVTCFNEKFIRMWGIPDDLATRADDYALLDFVVQQVSPELFIPLAESSGLIHSI